MWVIRRPARQQGRVVDLHRLAVAGHGPRSLLDDHRLELLGQSGQQVGGEEHRPPRALAQVGEAMGGRVADHEQVAAGRHGLAQPAGDVEHAAVGRVQEVGGDEIEQAIAGGKRTGVDLPPLGAVRHPGLRGMPRSPREPVGGEVGAGDRPAAAGQPDHVAALAAADVERGARGEAGDLGDELGVGVAAPDLLLGPVSLVPAGGLEHLLGGVTAAGAHATQHEAKGTSWQVAVPIWQTPKCARDVTPLRAALRSAVASGRQLAA